MGKSIAMAVKNENPTLTPEEKRFSECLTTGDDFTKIEIYRSAAAWYKKALELKSDDEEVRQKLEQIKVKIKKENRAIYAIVAVMFVVAFVTYMLI